MSNSFVFYETLARQLECLDCETKCKFYDAIVNYGFYGAEPNFTGIELSAWIPIQEAIDKAKKRIKWMAHK